MTGGKLRLFCFFNYYFILFSIFSFSAITEKNNLQDLILNSENYVKEKVKRISENNSKKCEIIKEKKCFSGSGSNNETQPLRFLEEEVSSNSISNLNGNCALLSCNSFNIFSNELRCLSNFQVQDRESYVKEGYFNKEILNSQAQNPSNSSSTTKEETEKTDISNRLLEEEGEYEDSDFQNFCPYYNKKNLDEKVKENSKYFTTNYNQKLLWSKSTIKLADENYPLTDSENIRVKEEICSTEFLNDDFKKPYEKNSLLTFQFYGTESGILRKYPGGLHCSAMDHRRDLWYDQAIRKPMNIVLGIDFSGSLNNGGKKPLLLKTLREFLNSLDSNIYIGVVSLSSPTEAVFPELFKKCTEETKTEILSVIEKSEFKGNIKQSNLSSEVKTFIRKSKELSVGANCEEKLGTASSNFSEAFTPNGKLQNTLVVYFLGSELNEKHFYNESTESKNNRVLEETAESEQTEQSATATTSSESETTEETKPEIFFNSIFVNYEIKNTGNANSTTEVSSNDDYYSTNKNKGILFSKQCQERSLIVNVTSPMEIELAINKINKYTTLGSKRKEVIWSKKNSSSFAGSLPVYSQTDELLGVFSVELDLSKIKNYNDYEFYLNFYTEKGESCLESTKVSDCVIEDLRDIKCFEDSKIFEQKCVDERKLSSTNPCLVENSESENDEKQKVVMINNVYNDGFYCPEEREEYKSDHSKDFSFKNIVPCCLTSKVDFYTKLANINTVSSESSTSTDSNEGSSSPASSTTSSEKINEYISAYNREANVSIYNEILLQNKEPESSNTTTEEENKETTSNTTSLEENSEVGEHLVTPLVSDESTSTDTTQESTG